MPTIYKGTVDFNAPDWGGWSESVYSDVNIETSQSMMQKMIQWLRFRMFLSIGPDNSQCANPVVPFAVRVEDELVLRDAFVNYCVPPGSPPVAGSIPIPPSFSVSISGAGPQNQNLDIELGARVKFTSGGNQQVATPMFHGMPLVGLANLLAAAPATAQFICGKLVRRFVDDNPPPAPPSHCRLHRPLDRPCPQ